MRRSRMTSRAAHQEPGRAILEPDEPTGQGSSTAAQRSHEERSDELTDELDLHRTAVTGDLDAHGVPRHSELSSAGEG